MPDFRDIERGWREQGLNAELPAELYEAIVSDSEGFDKRVVRNLAFHSVLIDESGEVIDMPGIIKQWTLKGIHYGEHETCAICNRFPIVEQCTLLNSESEHEIIVGNTCVLRFMDEAIEGDTSEEKRDFIKRRLKDDIKRQSIERFKGRFPTFWQDIHAHEDLLTTYRPTLLGAIVRRMKKHNYLTESLIEQWVEFLSLAPSLQKRYDELEAERESRRNALRERQNRIAILRQRELKQLRERRREIAKTIIAEFDDLKEFANDDEIEILSESLNHARLGGLPNRKASTVYEELNSRRAVHRDGSGITDAEQRWLHALDPGQLTKAERLFRYRVIAKPKISNADRSAIRRMKSRYGTHQT